MSEPDPAEPQDVLALSGLRRLVLHARDKLAASTVAPHWTYDMQAWKPAQVEAYAAVRLAEQTLTLVLDCIPAGDGPTADELAQRHREHVAHLERMQAETQRLNTVVGDLRQECDDALEERDASLEGQVAAEQVEADLTARLACASDLARTDPAAAARYLLGDNEDSTPDNPAAANPEETP